MEKYQLKPHQNQAIEAIQKAVAYNQKHVVVEMVSGTGMSFVLVKTMEFLSKTTIGKILVITRNATSKEEIRQHLFKENKEWGYLINDYNIVIETERTVQRDYREKITDYKVIIFYDVTMSILYETILREEKMVICFFNIINEFSNRFFTPKDVVFSYTFQQAIEDGYITPAMDAYAFEFTVETFTEQLLKEFGYTKVNILDENWDLVVQNGKQKIWVDCKTYKSQVVSPSAASSLLKSIVLKQKRMNIPQEDVILLIIFSRIPTFQKNEIYNKYKIVVLDIDNLVFYSKNNSTLLKRLSQIVYFPIDSIEGCPSAEAKLANLVLMSIEDNVVYETQKEVTEIKTLIQRLKNCKSGKKYSKEYEDICEKIIRTLFETNYFNRLTSQHKTNDAHFRMDLIGSLKINQNNEESMHPLWNMLVQYYNSHFIVFEFKNYSEPLDQNLIYITEKYLFDAALRNVAIIISRKGFSRSAKFAAEGCLKEHRKLILDITDDDLIKMLELESDKAADYILDKLEEFLMSISK